MSTYHATKKSLAIVGYVLLIPPICLSIMWLKTGSYLSPEGRRNAFVTHFPEGLQHFYWIVLFSLICSTVAVMYVAKSFNQPSVFLRIVDIIAAMIGALIILMNIFQLL